MVYQMKEKTAVKQQDTKKDTKKDFQYTNVSLENVRVHYHSKPEKEERGEASSLEPSSNGIVQRAVPSDGNTSPKPIPALFGPYNPKEDNVILENNKRPSGFIASTRKTVLQSHPHTMVGNRIITVLDASTGQHVNVESVQLDHQISWAHMSNAMINHNKSLLKGYVNNLYSSILAGSGESAEASLCLEWMNLIESNKLNEAWGLLCENVNSSDLPSFADLYTVADSRRYFNDISNLVPVLGAVNAQAGERGVTTIKPAPIAIEHLLGEAQLKWMRIQQAIHVLDTPKYNDSGDALAVELHSFNEYLQNLLNQLIGEDDIGTVDVGINTILAEASAINDGKMPDASIMGDTSGLIGENSAFYSQRKDIAFEKIAFDQQEKDTAEQEERPIEDSTIEYISRDQEFALSKYLNDQAAKYAAVQESFPIEDSTFLVSDELHGQSIEESSELHLDEVMLDENKMNIFNQLINDGFTLEDFDIMANLLRAQEESEDSIA